jgi:protein-S-isoprenylcysteine O-methyltransferase Ste14
MAAMRIVSWLVVVIYATIPAYWLAIHPFAAFWRLRRGAVMPLVGLIWLALMIAAALLTWPLLAFTAIASPWARLTALAFAVPGIYVYRNVRAGFSRAQLIGQAEMRPSEHAQALVTSGLRQRIRHPIYLGHLLIISAWTLAGGTWAHIALWLLALATGAVMIRFEEEELVQRFGQEYREYQKRVPAIVPRF